MDRLTARENGEAYYPECFERCGGDTDYCHCCELDDRICQRLAAYEDTGLTPEEIKHPQTELDQLAIESAKREITLAKLEAEVETALQEKQDRDKGCEHCQGWDKRCGANYCPMCGRKLEVRK